MVTEIIEKELSYQVMNAAYAVHNQLGPGFLEAIYEAALVLELQHRGFQIQTQVKVPVFYQDSQVGEHVLDVLLENKLILELKAVSGIAPIHKQQALSYLKATNLKLAIVINFGTLGVQSERVVNTKKYWRHSRLRDIRVKNYLY